MNNLANLAIFSLCLISLVACSSARHSPTTIENQTERIGTMAIHNFNADNNQVTFRSFRVGIACGLYTPDDFDPTKKYTAIVSASPFPQVKDQIPATNGPKMAKRRFRKGSKLRQAEPEKRHPARLDKPQTEWDTLHGTLMAHREADSIGDCTYLTKHAEGKDRLLIDLPTIWAAEVGDQKLQHEAQAVLYGLDRS